MRREKVGGLPRVEFTAAGSEGHAEYIYIFKLQGPVAQPSTCPF